MNETGKSSEGDLEEAREGADILEDEGALSNADAIRKLADTFDSLTERLRKAEAALEAFRENCRCTHAHEAADRLLALTDSDETKTPYTDEQGER